VFIRRRQYRALVASAAVAALAFVVLAGLREFLRSSLLALGGGTEGDLTHARGLSAFYSTEVLRAVNLIGGGPGNRSIPENGLAFLLEQFGAPALGLFVAVCLSVERYCRREGRPGDTLAVAAAALALGTIVVSHFAEYALSFTAYFAIWSVLGLAVARVRLEALAATPSAEAASAAAT
jgi:hypothetical protein